MGNVPHPSGGKGDLSPSTFLFYFKVTHMGVAWEALTLEGLLSRSKLPAEPLIDSLLKYLAQALFIKHRTNLIALARPNILPLAR